MSREFTQKIHWEFTQKETVLFMLIPLSNDLMKNRLHFVFFFLKSTFGGFLLHTLFFSMDMISCFE